MKSWTLVTAHFDQAPEDWSPAICVFEDHGVSGTVQTDFPATLGGYLYEGQEAEPLREALMAFGAREVTVAEVVEQDWANAWREFFKPRRVGRKIVIRPAWEDAEIGPDDIEIVLDPGQAFGTGEHPTTRMCLELLEDLDLNGKAIADIGCGSGILSVAALKMGAASAVGVDCEAPCVDASRENAERNQVEFPVHLGAGFDPLGPGLYPVVVSNIISAALIRLAPEAAGRVEPGGAWVVSGIIHANWPDVVAAAERVGFRLERKLEEGDWVAATFRR